MAKKKSKRPNLPQETLDRARAELRGDLPAESEPARSAGMNGSGAAVAASRPKTGARTTGTSAATRRVPTLDELRAEYSYVSKDLRKLVIVAVALFLIIITAALVLPPL